jgi:hypothetical protein
MQLKRGLPLMGVAVMAVAIACSDSGSTAPNGPLTTVAAGGQSDTGKTPPTNPTSPAPKPDSAKPSNPSSPNGPTTQPDTGVHPHASTDPRSFGGTVVGMGAAPDTANYQKIAGATVVLAIPGDTAAGTADKEIARATTGADGTFALGTFKLGVYMLTVTPPAGSPYKNAHWAFGVDQYSAAKIDLMVWLGRK